MKPIYTDIHIHTSENPDSLNQNYDIDTLFVNIRQVAQGAPALISFTDHNTINKKVYMDALSKCASDIHLILGVELHIHYAIETEAYHCHMLFKDAVSSDNIDRINSILDQLYPKKSVPKKDASIPTLDKLITGFDSYDFVLLPHGGQSHATFDKAIPDGKRFDTMMERSIYYNQFDGFTARSNSGREETDRYFRRLGISSFVNLVTCSDNYTPNTYPSAKAIDAGSFLPTWMFAEPTFEGFRLSLSENSRLVYSEQKPEAWSENIESVKCQNDKLDIDIHFSPGLNVVIGGSSSGKTLLVDSVWRKLSQKGFGDSSYNSFDVANITIVNPSGKHPHYINQNFIVKVVGDDESYKIENIEIIQSLFPNNSDIIQQVNEKLATLKNDITELINTVAVIKEIEDKFNRISQIGRLLVFGNVRKNIVEHIKPSDTERQSAQYTEIQRQKHLKTLEEIKNLLDKNPFVESGIEHITALIGLINKMYRYSGIESEVYQKIKNYYDNYSEQLKSDNYECQTKTQEFNELLEKIKRYVFLKRKFQSKLDSIAAYNYEVETKEIISAGHHLFVNNSFKLDKNLVLDIFNSKLKSGVKINSFDEIQPKRLFEDNFSRRNPKVEGYADFIARVYHDFEDMNKTKYKIVTKEGKNFENLSAGWKTSVLLDLILGYNKDNAPIIIDQPEDNLATKYINDGLVQAIKKVKNNKQIILVSHNATIPMMGDAQTIIYCENQDGKIVIRSSPLEGDIAGKPVLDFIASITDGGKSSIKKRVKKYNLKKFNE